MLGTLPARKALSGEIEDAAYAIVMERMTVHGLEEAVRAALRGEHGSEFFPSPPALKSLYDKAMEHHVRERERIARRERLERERIPDRVEPTAEEKARVAEIMAAFHANHKSQKQHDFEAERAETRARYGITPEAMASIPDASTDWRKLGK